MDALLTHCAALAVHKATVQACCLTPGPNGKPVVEERKIATFTADLITLRYWFKEAGITHVAMESTGSYWRPIYNLLEGHFELLLVNPRHVKNVPGLRTQFSVKKIIPISKTSILQKQRHTVRAGTQDRSERCPLARSTPPTWLVAPLLCSPEQQRALQDLTRLRTSLVEEQNRLVNRIQKTLEDANIKLACVASDVVGVSGRQILAALLGGERDPQGLAQLAKGKMRSKLAELEAALLGHLKPHHALILTELLCQIDSLDASIQRLEAAIEEGMAPFGEAVVLLDSVPGIGPTTAHVILAEIGTDRSRFLTAGHLCAWAGVAAGNHASAGKQKSGKTRKGNNALRRALVEAARAGVKAKGS